MKKIILILSFLLLIPALIMGVVMFMSYREQAIYKFTVQSDAELSLASYNGTLFEIAGQNGTDNLTVGILSTYETRYQRNGPIYAFRPTEKAVLQDIGRPDGYFGFYLTEIDGNVAALPRKKASIYFTLDNGKWTSRQFEIEKKCGRLKAQSGKIKSYQTCVNIGEDIYYQPKIQGYKKLYPLFVGTQVIIWEGPLEKGTGLVAQHRVTKETKTFTYSGSKEFAYAIWERENQEGSIMISTGSGTNIEVMNDLSKISILEVNPKSYQIYSAAKVKNGHLLGHFPSGQLYFDDGENITPYPDIHIPLEQFKTRATYEAQSVHPYNGDIYVGLWPFGQVFRIHENKVLDHERLFSAPNIDDPINKNKEPYRSKGNNRMGQRVTDMILIDGELYLSTNSKTGIIPPSDIPNREEYGKIWKISAPNNISFDMPSATKSFDIIVYKNKIEIITQSGTQTQQIDATNLSDNIIIGDGSLGKISNGVTVKRRAIPLADASKSMPVQLWCSIAKNSC